MTKEVKIFDLRDGETQNPAVMKLYEAGFTEDQVMAMCDFIIRIVNAMNRRY